ncbi:hypothetical protein [Pandoraea pnomenusa]|uniref:hypothetical protein n=1 Tax=Pandoraea pnomenusa TaxID=93220 RepID=UPI001AD00393|nr:hypothetical protein [Pandoraea pnomenusa]MBN9096238.1 hypothetical protein [Pandoraea pnomenusa]
MEKNELALALKILKLGREAIVADFCTENPDLYEAMFDYEPSSGEMDVALSRYSFNWLSRHPNFFEKFREDEGLTFGEISPKVFFQAYRNLCESFLRKTAVTSGEGCSIFEQSIQSSVRYLDELLEAGGRSDERMRRLVYESKKSRKLFERLCNELKGSSNGNS